MPIQLPLHSSDTEHMRSFTGPGPQPPKTPSGSLLDAAKRPKKKRRAKKVRG